MLDLTCHDRLSYALILKKRDDTPKLPYADRGQIFSNYVDARIGLILDRNDGKRHSRFTCSFNNKKRELAVAGNEAVVHNCFSKSFSSSLSGVAMMRSKLKPSFSRSLPETSLSCEVIAKTFVKPSLSRPCSSAARAASKP